LLERKAITRNCGVSVIGQQGAVDRWCGNGVSVQESITEFIPNNGAREGQKNIESPLYEFAGSVFAAGKIFERKIDRKH
jgi:hypothetical protein